MVEGHPEHGAGHGEKAAEIVDVLLVGIFHLRSCAHKEHAGGGSVDEPLRKGLAQHNTRRKYQAGGSPYCQREEQVVPEPVIRCADGGRNAVAHAVGDDVCCKDDGRQDERQDGYGGIDGGVHI